VRGHSNVQGDRTMGITSVPKQAFLDRLQRELGFEPPRRPGLDTVGAIEAMDRGDARVFIAMGGNFCAAAPDTEVVARALTACALTAHVSTKVNRSHLYPGTTGLILPCLGRSEIDVQAAGEQFVTVEDSMSIVHRSRGKLAPASAELRSEPSIVAGLACAILGGASGRRSNVKWEALAEDYDRIRDLISRVVPSFEDYNERVRSPSGFRLPNAARERSFTTLTGKAMFSVQPLPDLDVPPGRLRMMTIRSHDQYNTTVYGLDDRYRGGRAPRFIAVAFDIPRGCAATYFPEANPLVPLDSKADKSNTPTSKSVVIRVVPSYH
jgi:anaerobic selenocysteine-containing dehydrogenase